VGVILGIVILALIIWACYAGYIRVLASKRYDSKQRDVPDLNRFADRSHETGAGANGPNDRNI
jgi:hypothetical protein